MASGRVARTILHAGCLLLLASQSYGSVLDFEALPDGTRLTNQYPGVSFLNTASILVAGISLNEFEFPPHAGSHVVMDLGGGDLFNF